MPIYEYQCSQCRHQLESFEKMTDTPLTDCPLCGKPALQKLVSAAGFHLKGTGWYATDFRAKAKEKDKDKISVAETKENKPENKPESKPKDETKSSTDSKTKETAVTE